MPVSRFKCSRCGVDATRVGVGERGLTSVNAEDWRQRCVLALEARGSDEPVDPLALRCPYLNEQSVSAAETRSQGL